MSLELIFRILAIVGIHFTILINMSITEINNKATEKNTKTNSLLLLLLVALFNAALYWFCIYIIIGDLIWT